MTVLPLPPFGEKTVTTLPVAPFALLAVAASPQREQQRFDRLRQHEHVRGADLSPASTIPLRLAVGRKDERCPRKRAELADVFGHIASTTKETTWRATSTDDARRRPLPSVARTIESVGWSARLGASSSAAVPLRSTRSVGL